jgi:LPPG:FO 2-phospho-L-lactate transferase
VRRRCQPRVSGFEFRGSDEATAAPGVVARLERADGIVICPSNPWVSIAPILSIPAIRAAIGTRRVVAISPIIGGRAVRGPAAKMYRELGFRPSAATVAQHYLGVAQAFVLDRIDAAQEVRIQGLGLRTLVTSTMMRSNGDRRRLATHVLDFMLGNKT